ncbi:MAG: hypothetical protein WAZ77_19070 [Candidatus Nitrosopolaris sp.]
MTNTTSAAIYYAEISIAKIFRDHHTGSTVLKNVIKIFVVGIITIFIGTE